MTTSDKGLDTILSDEAVASFKAIYERDYGEAITLAEARRMANELLRFYVAILRSEVTVMEDRDKS